jgi:hypothetical protein
MGISKKWMAMALVISALSGAVALVDCVSTRAVVGEDRIPAGDHWRNHDGHWSMWNAADKRWYYTDGRHWFYHDAGAWKLYRFVGHFGRSGFVHGEYRVPPPDVKIAIPRHEIFIR